LRLHCYAVSRYPDELVLEPPVEKILDPPMQSMHIRMNLSLNPPLTKSWIRLCLYYVFLNTKNVRVKKRLASKS